MKFALKTLLTGFGLLVVVWVVLFGIERKVAASKAQAGLNKRLGPRASGDYETLSPKEVKEVLKKVIIPTVNFENVTLAEALNFVNAEIAKQIPEDQLRPKVLMDPATLKWSRERHRIESQDEDLKAALGGIELPPMDEMQIEELRVRNIPSDALIQYICDATKVYYYIYRGDVYMTIGCEACSMDSFRNDKVFERIQLEEVRLDHLVAKLDDIIDSSEFRGPKAGISVRMSEKGRRALKRNEIPMPVISLDIRNVTLNQVVTTIAEQSDGVLIARSADYGALVYDPLKEGIGTLDDPFQLGAEAKPGGCFDVTLDENWRAWKAPEIKVKHFSTSKEELPELLLEE